MAKKQKRNQKIPVVTDFHFILLFRVIIRQSADAVTAADVDAADVDVDAWGFKLDVRCLNLANMPRDFISHSNQKLAVLFFFLILTKTFKYKYCCGCQKTDEKDKDTVVIVFETKNILAGEKFERFIKL